MMPVVCLILGVAVGAAAVWLVMKGRIALAQTLARAQSQIDQALLEERLKVATQDAVAAKSRAGEMDRSVADLASVRAELQACERQLNEWKIGFDELKSQKDSLVHSNSGLESKITELNVTLENEKKQAKEKLDLLNAARGELTNQFKNLANEILEEKSKKFTEQNKTNLGELLNPFKEKIESFQKKVEDCYDKEGKDRSALAKQVEMLAQLNTTLSQDAQNLTTALRGDQKMQGNWGEILLQDILERSGLKKGETYEYQSSIKSEDGQSYLIPDVVVHLPNQRHIVIDSKMSLPAYNDYCAACDDGARAVALKRHLDSIRSHMKGLCEKQYQSLYGLNSLDFVVMFVPLEPAFMLAVTNDRELFHDGYQKSVLLVSPSTLLFVIRTIANLWRQEDISRNAHEISRRGAELYEKLVGFVNDFQKIGEKLTAAQDSLSDARKKLSEGKGNVIRQAELLKDLGVKPSKNLPANLVDVAMEDPIKVIADQTVAADEPAAVEAN